MIVASGGVGWAVCGLLRVRFVLEIKSGCHAGGIGFGADNVFHKGFVGFGDDHAQRQNRAVVADHAGRGRNFFCWPM